MTMQEALAVVHQAGAHLALDEKGPVLRGSVPAEVVEVLRAHRDRVAAILRLREVHRAMGLSEEDVLFMEEAMLSGRVSEIRIVARPPVGPVA